MPQRYASPIIVCLALALALISMNAGARSRAEWSRPSSVVVLVNIDTVMSGLDEFVESRTRIDDLGKSLEKGLGEVRDQLQKNKTDLEMMKERSGTQEYRQLLAKRVELVATGKGREIGSQQVIDEQGGVMLRALYVKIVDAVTRYAAAENIDLVVRDDRDVLPPEQTRDQSGESRPLTSREIRSVVEQRSVLCASKQIDISRDIITMMNNEFQATRK